MKVEKIDHIHIAVKDLDKAIKFFTDVLGTTVSGLIQVPQFSLRSVITPEGIELIESTSPNGPIAKFIEKRGEGLHAISLKVPNLDEAVVELQAKGLRLVSRVELRGLREAQFHPKDSFGVMIELCEYSEKHGAAQAGLGR